MHAEAVQIMHVLEIAGIQAGSRMNFAGPFTGSCIRPFLPLRKADLIDACQLTGLPWVEDPTNLDTSFARNRLRSVLQKSQPSQERLARAAAEAAAVCGRPAQQSAAAASLPASGQSPLRCEVHDSCRLSLHGEEARTGVDGDSSVCAAVAPCRAEEGLQDETSIADDVQRLISACAEAHIRLSRAAASLRHRGVATSSPDWSTCTVHSTHLTCADASTALRALASILQVNAYALSHFA
jgi:hypothetical protein